MSTPITIITGFLGSGKTTLILNLIPQLPKDYKLALLKNEFGDVAIDSQLASSAAISGVQELLNGCICCNLVGQLGDALETLRKDISPDRIIVETSGSALPTTLVLEINRLARETGHYSLDGVISVIDVQNWTGYEDTSYTAKIQAQHTDLIVLNKWELVDERKYDICLDRIGDLDVDTPTIKSDKGKISREVVFGIDGSLARELENGEGGENGKHGHHDHTSEVEVLSCSLSNKDNHQNPVQIEALMDFLNTAPRDEVYRIKAKIHLASRPASSGDGAAAESSAPGLYILNWAFGRWTFTEVKPSEQDDNWALRMTVITARYASNKWKKILESRKFLKLQHEAFETIKVEKIV